MTSWFTIFLFLLFLAFVIKVGAGKEERRFRIPNRTCDWDRYENVPSHTECNRKATRNYNKHRVSFTTLSFLGKLSQAHPHSFRFLVSTPTLVNRRSWWASRAPDLLTCCIHNSHESQERETAWKYLFSVQSRPRKAIRKVKCGNWRKC